DVRAGRLDHVADRLAGQVDGIGSRRRVQVLGADAEDDRLPPLAGEAGAPFGGHPEAEARALDPEGARAVRDRRLDEVHGGGADEPRDEAVPGPPVELEGLADLLDPAV